MRVTKAGVPSNTSRVLNQRPGPARTPIETRDFQRFRELNTPMQVGTPRGDCQSIRMNSKSMTSEPRCDKVFKAGEGNCYRSVICASASVCVGSRSSCVMCVNSVSSVKGLRRDYYNSRYTGSRDLRPKLGCSPRGYTVQPS